MSINSSLLLKENNLSLSIGKKIDQIASYLINKPSLSLGYGLISGLAGEALFLFQHYKYSNSKKSYHRAIKLLEIAIKEACENSLNGSFCNGLAGLAWLIEYLNKNEFIDIDVDAFLKEVDPLLHTFFNENINKGNYDFLHGAIGCGYYFLNKSSLDLAVCNRQIHALRKISVERNNEMLWIHQDPALPNKKVYNLGLAHGIPSIISYLSYAFQKNIEPDVCCDMLEKSVNFIKSCQQNPDIYGSFFPYSVTKAKQHGLSRLAWCYGDLGIGLSLLKASEALDNITLKKFALGIFDFHAKSIDLNKYGVCDAGLCHGSSGISQIFQVVNRQCPKPQYNNSVEFWLQQTLKMANFNDGICGFKSFNALDKKYEHSSNLLEGVAGIGLTLINSISMNNPTWDECLLIS